MDGGISRRSVLAGGSLLAAALALGVDLTGCTDDHGDDGYLVLNDHEATVVVEATARLIPGPLDEPSEHGHPGAREANVVRYIDGMLGALREDREHVYTGGPFSNRGGATHNDMADFVALPATVRAHWKRRLDRLAADYRRGVRALDRAAGGSFVAATRAGKDAALTKNPGGFRDLLFQHAIEGCYAVPEYGGNRHLSGWHEIGFPGDNQPRGYPDHEVSTSDGPDRVARDGIVDKVLDLLESSSPASTTKLDLIGPARRGHR